MEADDFYICLNYNTIMSVNEHALYSTKEQKFCEKKFYFPLNGGRNKNDYSQ